MRVQVSSDTRRHNPTVEVELLKGFQYEFESHCRYMDRYYIERDMTEGYFDFKYTLRKGDPKAYNDRVESFTMLFFAKRKARKLIKTKKRYFIVWDSRDEE